MTRLRDRARGLPVEALVVLALVVLAALTRLPGLDERGSWDADQGHDMLVLQSFIAEGVAPLLGPPTSIGTFHHGAAYYYLLAPAALVSGADPVAVTAWIALIGIGAVAATWWLAREAGGPLAGALAGLLAAVSPAGINESTFIWNPNLVPLAAALAFAGMLRARRTGRGRWWLVAAAGAMVTMQCHVLGVVIVPPLLLAWLAEIRVRRRAGGSARPLLASGAAAAAIILAGYVPLAVHELTAGFSETRAILDYLAGGGGASGGLVERVVMVGFRALTWPLTGLLTDRPAMSAVAAIIAASLVGVAAITARGWDRAAVRWLIGSLGWSVLALAVFAPSLAIITPGLPNDHYHAFLDPLVLALAGVGVGRIASRRAGNAVRLAGAGEVGGSAGAAEATGPGKAGGPAEAGGPAGAVSGATVRTAMSVLLAGALTLAVAAVGIASWPPRIAEDGGWRLVSQAATRVVATTGRDTVALDGIPPFKSADALRFPLDRAGALLLPAMVADSKVPDQASWAVIVCDPLFAQVVGAACGGPAEDAWLARSGRPDLWLADRFDAGTRRVVSVFAAGTP
jgi:hypothetical protein